ncbi:unnamed protein product [Nippostrongylus brasiliensis]|uniref:Sphingomyelin synthase-related 2 (inferred by orthology to a C. elegans protein) n=1 Tax=Nippostrongylus brasiliensis TaxID=27835 RepID=A0A0N4YE81_NIPBR|nr:unnamed protein product [Nippostrongylus brasiliensis]
MIDKEKREILPTSITKSYVVRRLPTVFAMGFVGLGWTLNEVALAWIHERVPRDTKPLPDLWFSWFPEVVPLTEFIYRWVVSRRVLFCAALAYCFRALCITIFQVPVPSVHTYCAPKTNGSLYIVSARVARMFWSAGIEQLRPRELCGDLIVSGHTLTIFTSFYTFKYYAPKKLKVIRSSGSFSHQLVPGRRFKIFKSLFINNTFSSYTVSTRVFMEYHALMVSYHEHSLEKNILSWSWWARIVPYFEKDAPPPHAFHNRIEWPSSCPQRIRRRLV